MSSHGWDSECPTCVSVRRGIEHGICDGSIPVNQVDDFSDDMCDNCVTPWKCNGPHVVTVTPEQYERLTAPVTDAEVPQSLRELVLARRAECDHEWAERNQGPGFSWSECWLCGEQTDYR